MTASNHQAPLSDVQLRVKALENLLVKVARLATTL